MKLIDKFITRSFFAPYFLSFIVAEFVLVMQFLWLYIDELAGKGLTMLDIAELVVYYGVLMIPLAVPITILISSVMVFGEISEKFELSSMKSAGISLLRVMRYGVFIAIATFGFSLFVSNYLKPKAAYSFNSKLLSIRKKKPSISLNEKVFNKDFSAHTVYIGDKNKNGKDISKVKMYNHSQRGNVIFSFVTAEDGSMYSTEDEKYFIIDLRKGNQYQELRSNSDRGRENYPFIKTTFKEWQKVFDLSEFNLENINPGLFSNKRELMNTVQLIAQVDSSTNRIKKQMDALAPILPKYTEWPSKQFGTVTGNRNEGYQFGASRINEFYGKIDRIQMGKPCAGDSPGSSTSTTSAIIEPMSVKSPPRPKARNGVGRKDQPRGRRGRRRTTSFRTRPWRCPSRRRRPAASRFRACSQVMKKITPKVEMAPSVPAYPANSAPRA